MMVWNFLLKQNYGGVMSEVRGLLLLLGCAVLSAAFLAFGMFWYYDTGGVYRLDRVLLSPDTLAALHFEGDAKLGQSERFVFDSILLSNIEKGDQELVNQTVDTEAYRLFYELIRKDYSLVEGDKTADAAFTGRPGARLAIQVRPAKGGRTVRPRTFQEIHFSSEGDHYRVELRNASAEQEWAYFYHEGLWEKASPLLYEEAQ